MKRSEESVCVRERERKEEGKREVCDKREREREREYLCSHI